MTFEEFERRKTIDDYSKYHESNHVYFGELIEKLPSHQVADLALKIREYVRGECVFEEVNDTLSTTVQTAADIRKLELQEDYKNGWSYPVEAA